MVATGCYEREGINAKAKDFKVRLFIFGIFCVKDGKMEEI